jgi:hypothetical protein
MDLLVAGIEPATHCLEGNCSTDELYKFLAVTIQILLQVSIVCPPWAHYAVWSVVLESNQLCFSFAETNLNLYATLCAAAKEVSIL